MPLSELEGTHGRAVRAIRHALGQDRLHHAYILASPDRGESKRVASAIAQTLVCTSRQGIDACGTCPGCRTYQGGNHADVFTLSPNEKNVIPIEPVRALTARLALKASAGSSKVVQLFDADRMNPAAQNALLKTLEEPSGDTCFLLTAARPRSLLITVRSRCQKLQLGAADLSTAVTRLVDGGLDATLARDLAPIVGADVERALALEESGAAEIIGKLDAVLAKPENTALALETAKDLGSNRDRADLALSVLEVRVRDAFAQRGRAPIAGSDTRWQPTALGDLVDTLHRLRRLHNRSLNRTLALESIFLRLGT
ncbi:MAG: hypothetical protein AAF654_03430 [Myxococcota bacterium]